MQMSTTYLIVYAWNGSDKSDIETDVMNVTKKDSDQYGNDRNIKDKVKRDLNLEKYEKQNEQTNKGTRKCPIKISDNILWN